MCTTQIGQVISKSCKDCGETDLNKLRKRKDGYIYPACYKCLHKRYRTKRLEYQKGYNKRRTLQQKLRRYGLTQKQYEYLWSDPVCAVCSSTDRIVIDHDHVSGKVRGLLCTPCNLALGHVKDSTKILSDLIGYLERRG